VPQKLVGWVYLEEGFTIRWRRGDSVAYVFACKQMKTYPDKRPTVPVLATIPVHPSGWTDSADIQRVGEQWVRERIGKPGSLQLADQLRTVLSNGNPTDEQIRKIVARNLR